MNSLEALTEVAPSYSKELIRKTIDVWQSHSKEKLTEQDAVEIMTNMVGFFNALSKAAARIESGRSVQDDGRVVLAEKATEVEAQKETKGNTRLVTVKEMADILHVSPSWIYRRTYLGPQAIPFIKVGRYVRFDPQEVISFFKTKAQSDAIT